MSTADVPWAKGDRARVSFEGEVTRVLEMHDRPGHYELRIDVLGTEQYVSTDSANVAKIAPAVEIFKPGDVVRHLRNPMFVYTVGRDGFLAHHTGGWVKDDEPFTSEYYERVNIG